MNIIITGASRGIGAELLKYFAAQQDNTIVCISRNEKKLQELLSETRTIKTSSQVISLPLDISRLKEHPEILLGPINKIFNKADILINNAGFLANKSFLDISEDDIQSIFEVNFFAAARLVRLLFPYLKRASHSHVVNISSMGGFQGSSKFPGLSYYSASKAALASLTECLATEFSQSNISFNCLALGAVQTEMLEEAFPGYEAPLKADEMAKYIAEFALSGHQFFNGKIIPVSVSNP